MTPKSKRDDAVDLYISGYPESVQKILRKMRRVVKSAAPRAEEVISYGVPTFRVDGKNIVHFGAFKDHVAFFPTASGKEAFKKELSKYKGGRGTVQFPLEEEIPYDLVTRIVKYRLKEEDLKRKKK